MFGNEGDETNVLVSESTRTKWVVRKPNDYILVGDEGFEPPVPDSESGALPLGESPTVELSVGNFGFLQALSLKPIFIFFCQ